MLVYYIYQYNYYLGTITIGGGGDSFYEYLIKNYMLQTTKNEAHKKTWQNAVESIQKYMLSPTLQNPKIQYISIIENGEIYYISQELICYWPGNILLGISQVEDAKKKLQYKSFANVFFKSCIETWEKTETKIAPEIWSWIPLNNNLKKKLEALLLLENKSPVKKIQNKVEKRRNMRSFSIDNPIYDLRPG